MNERFLFIEPNRNKNIKASKLKTKYGHAYLDGIAASNDILGK